MAVNSLSLPAGKPLMPQRDAAATASLWRLLPVILLIYAALLPQEIRAHVGDQSIYPPRGVAILLLPWLIDRLAKGQFAFRLPDLLMFTSTLWMTVSFIAFYGLGDGLSRGGSLTFDMIMPYLIVRICIRSMNDLRRILIVAAPGVALAGLSMMAESITHVLIVKPAAASIFGPLPVYENGDAVANTRDLREIRFGLMRAYGPFQHPILAGLFLASMLPLYWKAELRSWPRLVGIAAALLSFFSVSSTMFLSLLLGTALMAFDWFQERMVGIGWRLLLALVVLMATALQLGSENGLVPVIIRYTIDPATGYFRVLIWQFGSASVGKHPWFGIGLTDYERLPWMVNSIDNQWLLLGIRHGFITPVLLMLACMWGIGATAMNSARFNPRDRRLAVALAISLTLFIIAGFTVSFFGGALTWFAMLIGLCMTIGYANPDAR